ncbi:odorant receptor 46a isoform X2 [Plodia interpunctella]|uniref:odorant receptor 46a isoform X2 n=1 Tax=Plodia interpunctella TaxID=58824 RepID=UPI0023676473|nr:odorant receptor 46a-like isoform X2 [Plodia interpunctella]
MKILTENMKKMLSPLQPAIPYGVLESWEDLNPRLYHAVHIYWLKFYGMWYNNFSPKNILFWVQLTYTIVVLWLVCFLPGIGEVVYLLKRSENIANIAEGLYLFLSEMYTYFKITVFWLNKDKVMSLLEYLHCDQFKPTEAEHREIIRKSIKTARFVMTYYSTICVGAVLVGIIMPLTEKFTILPTNVEYPFFDVYKSPAYETLYVHHIYYKPATCIIDGVMDTILAAFVACATQRRLQRAIAAKDPSGAYHRDYHIHSVLKDCVRHHNSIIRYVSMIEGAFSLASALQFMLSVMVLCLVGVQFLSIHEPAKHPMQIMWMAIYLTCMLIEVFILCWFGDVLIWKSIDLSHAAFEGPWINTEQKSMKYIVIFMERCKRPMKLTAGKVFTLSLDTYTILINWSYKAFAVMSNMKK